MAQVTGKVKWYDVRKGYGYICDENGNDYFAHFSGITKGRNYTCLRDGDEVTFEVSEGNRGPQATDIKITTPFKPYVKRNNAPAPQVPQATAPVETASTETTEVTE